MILKLKTLFLSLLLVISMFAVSINSRVVFAASGSLSLSPASATITKGSTQTIQILANTGGGDVITVSSVLSYNINDVSITIDTSPSATDFPTTGSESVGGGYVRIERGTSPAKSGVLKVAKITVTALRSGKTTPISFDSESALYTCDDPCSGAEDVQDILTQASGGSYTLAEQATPTPSPQPTPAPVTPDPTPSPQPTPAPVTPDPTPSPQPTPKAVVSDPNALINEDGKSYTVTINSDKEITGSFNYKNKDDTEKSTAFKSKKIVTIDIGLDDIVPGESYSYVLSAKDSSGVDISKEGAFTVPGYQLTVNVKDAQGQPLSNVNVGTDGLDAVTNQDGIAEFTNLKPGRYEVSVTNNDAVSTYNTLVNSPLSSLDVTLEQVVATSTSNRPFILGTILATVVLLAAALLVLFKKGVLKLPKRKPHPFKLIPNQQPKPVMAPPKPVPAPIKVPEPVVPKPQAKKPDDPGIKNPGAGKIVLPNELSDNQKMILQTFNDKPISEIEERLGVRRDYNEPPNQVAAAHKEAAPADINEDVPANDNEAMQATGTDTTLDLDQTNEATYEEQEKLTTENSEEADDTQAKDMIEDPQTKDGESQKRINDLLGSSSAYGNQSDPSYVPRTSTYRPRSSSNLPAHA